MRLKVIRVLQVISSLESGGGVQQLLYNYYNHMDRQSVKFDFIVHDDKIGSLEAAFESWGCKVYHVTTKKESFRKNLKDIDAVVASGNYDIMHCHQGFKGIFALRIAKKRGIDIRISHNHQAFIYESIPKRIMNVPLRMLLKHYASHWLACSYLAGEWAYGKKALKSSKFKLIHNAINLDQFIFSEEIRNDTRKILGTENKFVIGNVARFSHQKNHEYLIKIFAEVYRQDKTSVLVLVGIGELENQVRSMVDAYGLSEVVIFLGIRNDVPKLLQAFDLFLLPSYFEGLPIVLVETQAAGLHSIAADTITEELNITGLTEYISLKESPQFWANMVLKYNTALDRRNTSVEIRAAGYDISNEAKLLNEFFTNLCV